MTKPLCKDCIHFVAAIKMEYYASHQCSAARIKPRIEVVTGTVIPARNATCVYARQEGWQCGPEAKLFRSRHPAPATEAPVASPTPQGEPNHD